MSIIHSIYQKVEQKKKQLAFLIDPDKYQGEKLALAIDSINQSQPDLVMVGGSLVSVEMEPVIRQIKASCTIPVVIYPGSLLQLSSWADGLLFISLISGRNPDFLIGNHVVASPLIRKSGVEVIPTGYLLIDGGKPTSVQYMSNTQPIPCSKPDIAVATALAGQYLGMKLIYLDAGSGAEHPVPPLMIQKVKGTLSVPLMVGGGLNTPLKVEEACEAGADILVVGNAIEKDAGLLREFISIVRSK